MSYDNDKQVVVSKVVSDNPKAPTMRLRLELNGEKWETGLWPMTRKDGSVVKDKNGNTLYKGELSPDEFTPGGQNQRPQSAPLTEADAFRDDDIPW